MESSEFVIGGVVTAVLGGAGVLIKSWAESRSSRAASNLAETKMLSDLNAIERKDLLQAQQHMRNELSAQILDLRKQILDQHELNIKYVAENASLRTKVTELEKDNLELRQQVAFLQTEIDQLRLQNPVHKGT